VSSRHVLPGPRLVWGAVGVASVPEPVAATGLLYEQLELPAAGQSLDQRGGLPVGPGLTERGQHTLENMHEVAQAAAPEAHVVYVDHDEDIVARAQDTLGGAQDGRTAYIQADLREPERLLAHPKVLALIDFDRPVALLLVAVLHFFPDEYEPGAIVRTLVDALPTGSHVVASHVSPEYDPVGVARLVEAYRVAGVPGQARTAEELAHLVFDDLDLVHPGLVPVSHWWPEGSDPHPGPATLSLYGGVGRKD
jgi:hypothetical protein